MPKGNEDKVNEISELVISIIKKKPAHGNMIKSIKELAELIED